jgi:hypothetical protein
MNPLNALEGIGTPAWRHTQVRNDAHQLSHGPFAPALRARWVLAHADLRLRDLHDLPGPLEAGGNELVPPGGPLSTVKHRQARGQGGPLAFCASATA